MANANTLPHTQLVGIAQQVNERLIVRRDDTPVFYFNSLQELGSPLDSTVELGETFELWRLSFADVQQSRGAKLTALAKRIGCHHQLRLNGASVAFARSSEVKDENSWSVDEIFVSPLAEEINQAITWADDNVSDDKLARLLTVPSYQIEALWFVETDGGHEGASNSDVYIINSRSESDRLQPFQLITGQQFLAALRDEPPTSGIVPPKRVSP